MCLSLTIQDVVTALDVAHLRGHADVVDILVKASAEANSMVS